MATNRFAKIDSLYWLDLTFMTMMSPEVLHADGERSMEAAIIEASMLRHDYSERHGQLACA